MTGPLDFLSGPPTPVNPDPIEAMERPSSKDILPQAVADHLLRLKGVDGAWIEQNRSGERVVVLHYSPADPPLHLPSRVEGMAVKIVGGEPIRAQH